MKLLKIFSGMVAIAGILCSMGASAQVSGLIPKNTLELGAGPAAYAGENDWKVNSMTELITPAVKLNYVNRLSPVWGWGAGVTCSKINGLYQNNGTMNPFAPTDIPYTGAKPEYDYQNLYRQQGYITNCYVLGHNYVLNFFSGYNPKSIYVLDLYAGPGIMLGFSGTGKSVGYSINFGATNRFNLNSVMALFVDFHGALVNDAFDGESYKDETTEEGRKINHKMDLFGSITAGISVNIGGRL